MLRSTKRLERFRVNKTDQRTNRSQDRHLRSVASPSVCGAHFRWEFAHSRSIHRLNYFPCSTQEFENILVVNQDAILKDWQLLCSRELLELRVFYIARIMHQTI